MKKSTRPRICTWAGLLFFSAGLVLPTFVLITPESGKEPLSMVGSLSKLWDLSDLLAYLSFMALFISIYLIFTNFRPEEIHRNIAGRLCLLYGASLILTVTLIDRRLPDLVTIDGEMFRYSVRLAYGAIFPLVGGAFYELAGFRFLN